MPDIGQLNIKLTTGTYAHANGTSEDDAIEVTGNKDDIEIVMDCSALTQNTTIRTYEKIDGTTYIKISEAVYPTDFDADSITVVFNGKGADQKVTFESSSAEGASRDIDWRRVDDLRID